MSKSPKPIYDRSQFDPFSLWLNDYRLSELNPVAHHFSFCDIDKVVYRVLPAQYNPQAVEVFLLEVKSHGKGTVEHQIIFALLDAILKRLSGLALPCRIQGQSRLIRLNYQGFHILKMSGPTPDDSDSMTWDRHPISRERLFEVLRMERDPRQAA